MQPAVTPVYQTEVKPENYLLLSVLNMVLCCFLCGLIALIYSLQVRAGAASYSQPVWHNLVPICSPLSSLPTSSPSPFLLLLPLSSPPTQHNYIEQVDSAWNSGDREGAKRAAQTAKNWNIAGVVSGIIAIVLSIVIGIVGGVVVPLVIVRSSLRG